MGAWGSDPFDNDSAADFANDVEGTPKGERLAFLRKTLQEALEVQGRRFEPDYEFPYEYEFAIAAGAFLADARKGTHVFTDTVYAKALDDSKDFKDDDAWNFIEVEAPDEDLVHLAVHTLEKLVAGMKAARIDQEWIEPSQRIIASLRS